MRLSKFPIELRMGVRKHIYSRRKEFLERELKIFTSELRRYFSKEELKEIANETKFVQRKSKIDAWQMLKLCAFENIDIARDTMVSYFYVANQNNEYNFLKSLREIRNNANRNLIHFVYFLAKDKNKNLDFFIL